MVGPVNAVRPRHRPASPTRHGYAAARAATAPRAPDGRRSMSDSSQPSHGPIRLLATLAIASSLIVQTGCAAVVATGAVVGATVGLGVAVVGTAVGAGVAAGGAVIDAVSGDDDKKGKDAAPVTAAATAPPPPPAAPIVSGSPAVPAPAQPPSSAPSTPASAPSAPAAPAVEVAPVRAPATEQPKNVY